MRDATGLASRIAAENVHCLTAVIAAPSSSAPADVNVSTLETRPSTSTRTRTTTSAVRGAASADDG
jgi:hypothetical protein